MTIQKPNEQKRTAAIARQAILTKPTGALGRLEDVAIQLAALQNTDTPQVTNVHIAIFAGDHGVAAEGVSAFPQAVTAEMVKNFARGDAAICVAAQELGATLSILNMGCAFPCHDEHGNNFDNVKDIQIAAGTANFITQAAMTQEHLETAIQAGKNIAHEAHEKGCELFIGGEMGIANTTAASAIACALLGLEATLLSGPGTGLDAQGVNHKSTIIQKALDLHSCNSTNDNTTNTTNARDALEILRRLGGFEIAGLVGAYLACGARGIPILVDGFISSTAALVAARIAPELKEWMLFSHASAEPGHSYILHALAARPLLDIGMRLGEGSGAAVCVPLLRMACALHNKMATFADAEISEKNE